MRDEELAFDQVDVRFDAAEAQGQRVKERSFALIVVVRMRVGEEAPWPRGWRPR